MFFSLRQSEFNRIKSQQGQKTAEERAAEWREEAKEDLRMFPASSLSILNVRLSRSSFFPKLTFGLWFVVAFHLTMLIELWKSVAAQDEEYRRKILDKMIMFESK